MRYGHDHRPGEIIYVVLIIALVFYIGWMTHAH